LVVRTPDRLIVFDVDGTLTRTCRVDADCYAGALTEVFGLRDVDTDWSQYHHVTDSAILRQLIERAFGRAPTTEERAAFASRLCRLLTAVLDGSPDLATEVPGASALLRALAAEGRWAIALASGALCCSVRLKLATAGLTEAMTLPCATGDDGERREDIVGIAIARAASAWQVNGFSRVVAVGDGVWDVRAARQLGMPFVGVSAERGATALVAAGAHSVLDDFTDLTDVRAVLEAARVPGSESASE
jgi:phosphoglycolate phosphatase-like HAD superfamily hydrolase